MKRRERLSQWWERTREQHRAFTEGMFWTTLDEDNPCFFFFLTFFLLPFLIPRRGLLPPLLSLFLPFFFMFFSVMRFGIFGKLIPISSPFLILALLTYFHSNVMFELGFLEFGGICMDLDLPLSLMRYLHSNI